MSATGYTHSNVDKIEDLAPSYGMGEILERRGIQKGVGAEKVGMSHYRMRPGKRLGFGHKHDQAEEIYVVLEGSGRIKVDDEIRGLAALDVVRCAPEVVRELEAGPDGMTVLVAGNHVPGDGEIVKDWWTA